VDVVVGRGVHAQVVVEPEVRPDDCLDGADVDDAAAALLGHGFAEETGHQEHAGDVDLDTLTERVGVAGPAFHGAQHGVVDEHVDAAELSDHVVVQGLDGLLVALVERHGRGLEPAIGEFLGDDLELLDAAAGHDDVSAGLGEGFDDLAAEEAGPAGDQRDLVVEAEAVVDGGGHE